MTLKNLVVGNVVFAGLLMGCLESGRAHDEKDLTEAIRSPFTAEAGNGNQFVYPSSGWVAATSTYPSGEVHSGSIDIAAPVWTPIRAARAGTVVFAGNMRKPYRLGYSVVLSHGNGFQTFYGHMAQSPSVSTGASVAVGQLLGYIGSTGYSSKQHLHFSIMRNCPSTTQICCMGGPIAGGTLSCAGMGGDNWGNAFLPEGEQVDIPSLSFKQWKKQGTFIYGNYKPPSGTALSAISAPGFSTYTVKTQQESYHYTASTEGTQTGVSPVPSSTSLTVTDAVDGMYKVSYNSTVGWIPSTATYLTTVVSSAPYRLKVNGTASTNINAYTTSTGSTVKGTLKGGDYIDGYELQNGRYRVLGSTDRVGY